MFIYMRGAYSAFFSEFYLARAVRNLFTCTSVYLYNISVLNSERDDQGGKGESL